MYYYIEKRDFKKRGKEKGKRFSVEYVFVPIPFVCNDSHSRVVQEESMHLLLLEIVKAKHSELSL